MRRTPGRQAKRIWIRVGASRVLSGDSRVNVRQRDRVASSDKKLSRGIESE